MTKTNKLKQFNKKKIKAETTAGPIREDSRGNIFLNDIKVAMQLSPGKLAMQLSIFTDFPKERISEMGKPRNTDYI